LGTLIPTSVNLPSGWQTFCLGKLEKGFEPRARPPFCPLVLTSIAHEQPQVDGGLLSAETTPQQSTLAILSQQELASSIVQQGFAFGPMPLSLMEAVFASD
jgi:hypothetical protein